MISEPLSYPSLLIPSQPSHTMSRLNVLAFSFWTVLMAVAISLVSIALILTPWSRRPYVLVTALALLLSLNIQSLCSRSKFASSSFAAMTHI